MNKIEVGTRVAISNKRGTVKFRGHLNEVDGGRELWLGIDWDHAEEGKHDGSLKGVQYFKARYPTSGSFVKATQVQTGQPFMETLKNHYFELYSNVDNENGVQFVLKESAVSFENAFNMTAINLPTKLVSCLEPDADRKFEKCALLDLSCNLLQDWVDVFAILNLFPALSSLNISLNVMRPIKADMPVFECQIKELILNDCHLDLETLELLADHFPAVETLRIMKNELDTLPLLNKFTKLKSLHAGNNPFNDFTKLYRLASHPTLETLSLPNCGFKTIKIPEQSGFNSLKTLNLNENPLNDWESINELGRLPCLTNFRSSGLYAGERGCQSYEILTAKLPHLNVLDSCAITSSDRKECESFFVRHFSKDPLLSVHQADLDRLSKLYPEQLQPIPTRQIDSNSCTFTLKYNERSIERALLLNLSVRKLATLASRIFSFEPSSVRVLVQIFDDSYENLNWDSSTVLRAFEPQQGCIIKFVNLMMSESKERKILEFIIELGIRLECRSVTITYASIYFHKVYDLLPPEFCLYSVACTCMSLGAKAVEDQRIRIRHIVAVSYRILHPEDQPLPICDLENDLRKSIATLEQVILRLLKFDLKVDSPHNIAYIASTSLRSWFPTEMAEAPRFPIVLGTLLQDSSIYPDFILNNDPVCTAVVLISLALQLSNVKLDDRRWVHLITKQTSLERLQKLKRRFLRVVYNERI